MRWFFALVTVIVLGSAAVRAESVSPAIATVEPLHDDEPVVTASCDDCVPAVSRTHRVLATFVAATPVGFFARGAGSFLTGDRRTAKRLAMMGGIGAGFMLVGGLPTGISGGNPYLLIPFVPMLVAGTGMFMQSWFSDIYTAAGVRTTGTPRAPAPWSIDAGTIWVHDAYRDRALFRAQGRLAFDRYELTGAGYLHAGNEYRAGDLSASVRLFGAPPTGESIEDGSYVAIRATGRLRNDREDHVTVASGEVEVVGRLDLRRISDVLEGTYGELSTGGGVERASFGDASEVGGILLGRFAYGIYLGGRGEAQLFYDHRRDSLAGGIAAYRAAGFVGSVGASVDLRIAGPWAARAELEIGSAWVSSLGLRYQGGTR